MDEKLLSEQGAREQVEKLAFEFAWRVDHGRAHSAPELFCREMTFGMEGAALDRSAFEKLMATRDTASFIARHGFSNTLVTGRWADAIEATLIVSIHKVEPSEAGPQTTLLCADWRVRLEEEDSAWRFRSVAITPVALPS